MKNLRFHYHMDIQFSEPVYEHTYTLKCVPQTTDAQEITDCRTNIFPEPKMQQGRDSFGNVMLYGNVKDLHSAFSVDVTGNAKTGTFSPARPVLDKDIAIYRYQTPLTIPGKAITGLRQECLGKETKLPLFERVYAYMNAVYKNMHYQKGRTDISTGAEAALELGCGVCQDYAHILLSLCREDRIPARYVVGMLLGEGESHAWVEIFDGTRWIGLDPTNQLVVDDMHIKISHGRDYRDCSINRGVFTGQAQQTQRILVEVEEEKQE